MPMCMNVPNAVATSCTVDSADSWDAASLRGDHFHPARGDRVHGPSVENQAQRPRRRAGLPTDIA